MNTRTTKLLIGILIIFMTLTVVNVVVHLFKNEYVTETAVAISASNSIDFHGVYVRDEQVLNFSGDGVVSYPVNDGGRLSADETAVNIYASEDQININKKIKQIDSEISVLNKIQNPGTQEVAQPAYLASLIEEKYKSIAYYKEIGDLTQLANEKQELLIYLSTMQYVTEEVHNFSDKIASLQTEKDQLENKKVDPIKQIPADRSAYFVSYADGYENILTYDSVQNMTPEELNDITDYSMVSNATDAVGKLIYGYSWKIVGVIDDPRKTFTEGNTIDLYFPSCARTIDGTVESVRKTDKDGQVILTIRCTDMSYDFVQHRAETVEISNKIYEGIRIPRSAIQVIDLDKQTSDTTAAGKEVTTAETTAETSAEESTSDESVTNETTSEPKTIRGVYVKLGEKVVFKKIDVIFEGDDFVVSKAHTTDDYVQLYADIIVEGVDTK